VEIRVNNRTAQRKTELLRERRLTTIEVDLSKAPWFETQDDFEKFVLHKAERSTIIACCIFSAVYRGDCQDLVSIVRPLYLAWVDRSECWKHGQDAFKLQRLPPPGV